MQYSYSNMFQVATSPKAQHFKPTCKINNCGVNLHNPFSESGAKTARKTVKDDACK